MYWLLYLLNPHTMTIFVVIHKSCPNSCLFIPRESNQFDSSWLGFNHRDSNRHDSSWYWWDSNQRDYKFQNFCAKLFLLRNYSPTQHFRKLCCLWVFTFTYCCTMPRRDPVIEIRHSPNGSKEVESLLPSNLCDYASKRIY